MPFSRSRHPARGFFAGIPDVWSVLGKVVESSAQSAVASRVCSFQLLVVRGARPFLRQVFFLQAFWVKLVEAVAVQLVSVGCVVLAAWSRHRLAFTETKLADDDLRVTRVSFVPQAPLVPREDPVKYAHFLLVAFCGIWAQDLALNLERVLEDTFQP